MSNLKDQLVKLGSKRKDLRPHIRPVLAQLEKKSRQAPTLSLAADNWIADVIERTASYLKRGGLEDVVKHASKRTVAFEWDDEWYRVEIQPVIENQRVRPLAQLVKARGSKILESKVLKGERSNKVVDWLVEQVYSVVNQPMR